MRTMKTKSAISSQRGHLPYPVAETAPCKLQLDRLYEPEYLTLIALVEAWVRADIERPKFSAVLFGSSSPRLRA